LWVLAGWQYVQAQSDAIVRVLEATGAVTPAMQQYFERGIKSAIEAGDQAVLIVLDTPGGSVDVTLQIVQLLRNAPLPVIVYVAPSGAQAASAGSVVTLAAHAAGMAPETVMGAASPIQMDGSDISETAFRKAVEDLKAVMRNQTSRRGSVATGLAEDMIEEARAVTADEALEAGLIDAKARDVSDLLVQLDGQTVLVNNEEVVLQTADAVLQETPMTFVEQVLQALTNPVIIAILLAIATPAILIELHNPGGWVAGFLGIVCLILSLYGLGQLPVNWLGLGLIVIAFVLFVAEVQAPTHGALSLTGALTLLAGLLVLFNSPGTPEFARLSLPAAIAISGSTLLFFLFIVAKAISTRWRQPITGAEGLVGRVGRVRSGSHEGEGPPYSGEAMLNGELWRVQAENPLQKGDEVVVKGLDGITLRVGKINVE
jgi:membrane-bound serine protease (ClpP class)